MKLYVQLDAARNVVRAWSLPDHAERPNGALEVVNAHARAQGHGDLSVATNADLTLRGVIGRRESAGQLLAPVLSQAAAPMPGGAIIPPLAVGAVVEVFDAGGGEEIARLVADRDGWGEEIALPDAGRYVIEIVEPGRLPSRVEVMIDAN